MNFAGRKALVLGLGDTGLSMAKWLSRRGADVRVADTRAEPPQLEALRRSLPAVPASCGPLRDASFAGADLIAISPGLPLAEPHVQRALAAGARAVGDVELFAQALRAGERTVAITGTNGKTTVTSLAGAMARAAGSDCEVAGNIGPAVLDALMRREDAGKRPDLWVLELSSFQLETTDSLAAGAATVLNISEDHLDRYRGLDDYAAAKARIFAGGGMQVLNRDDARSLAMALPGRTTVTFGLDAPRRDEDWGLIERGGETWLAQGKEALLPVRGMKLAGLHNAANALAALSAAQVCGVPLTVAAAHLGEFRGIRRRLEVVGASNGITVIDDFAHNPDKISATLETMHAFPGRLLLMFQPHGYGPIRLMRDALVECFASGLQVEDVLVMPEPVYFGGTVDRSVGSKDIVGDIERGGRKAFAFADRGACGDMLVKLARPGDRIVVMGARDDSLSQFARELLRRLAGT